MKTRKRLRLFWGLYSHSDVDQLYLPRKMGDRGLRSIEDVVCEEKCSLSCYVKKSNDELTVKVNKACLLCESQSFKEYKTKKLIRWVSGAILSKALTWILRKSLQYQLGLFYHILLVSDLSIESKGFFLATQEQSLSTRAMAFIYDTNTYSACRLCGNHPETVEHLVSGCSKLAGTLCKLRHDNVLKYIRWLLCLQYSCPVVETLTTTYCWKWAVWDS